MRLLRVAASRSTTRYGGGFVQSIDGLTGGGAAGKRDWFFFVNGVEVEVGAADYTLSPGDRVQWDYRRWDAADARAGDRRRVPRAVPARHQGQAAAACASSATTTGSEPVQGAVDSGSTTAGVPDVERGARARPAPRRCMRADRGAVAGGARRARRAHARAGPAARAASSRASPDGSTLALLDDDGQRRPHRAPRRRHGAGRRAPSRARDEVALARHLARRDRAGGRRAGARRARPARRFAVAVTGRTVEKLPLHMTLIPAYRAGPAPCTRRAPASARRSAPRSRSSARSTTPADAGRGARRRRARRRGRRGRGARSRRSLRLALPFALLVAVGQRRSSTEGDTLLIRGGEFLGRRWDITLEATADGCDRTACGSWCWWPRCGLMSAAVDPDELLQGCCAACPTARRSPPRWPRGSCPCWPATPGA